MPPKSAAASSAAAPRVSSAKKKPVKLTKKQIEEQQAEMEAAQAAAAAAIAAREASAALARAEAEREANSLVVREDIQFGTRAPADVRAVMMRSFGHLYPTTTTTQTSQTEPIAPVVAPLHSVEESAAPTPLDSARSGGKGARSASKRASAASSVAGASPRPPSSGSAAPSEADSGEKRTAAGSLKKPSKRVPSAGKKRAGAQTLSSADVARHEAEEAAALEAQRAADAAAAAAAAAAEAERLQPRWSPEVEAELAALRDVVAAKAAYTAASEATIVDYYKSQAASDAAEAERLVNNGTRLHRGVDLPDEQRRLAETPLRLEPQPGVPPPPTGIDSSIAARSLPPRGDKQILSSSGLIDLQSILDRQRARQAKVNSKVTQGAPPPPKDDDEGAQARARKHAVRRMAQLDTGAGGSSASAGDLTPGTHKSSSSLPHVSAARASLLAHMLPVTEVKANQAILAHMQTLQQYPRNPRYDQRNARMGGPGGKGLMSSVKQARALAAAAADEEKQSDGALDNLGALAAALPQVSPRDDDTTAQIGLTLASLTDDQSRASCLQALPPVAWFTDAYSVGRSYDLEIEVRNIGTLSRRIRVEGPLVSAKNGVGAAYFSVGQPRYPATSSSALLAPGMSCFVPVRFTPDARTDYASQLSVVTETGRINVPLFAVRPKAGLDLGPTLNVGVCAWGDSVTRSWTVRNIGRAAGRFWLMDHSRFESLENRADVAGAQQASARNRPILPDPSYAAGASFAKHAPPLFTSKALVSHLCALPAEELEEGYTELELRRGAFKISPAAFELQPGQAIDLMIEYNPQSEARAHAGEHDPLSVESLSAPFLVVQDNSVVRRHALFGQTCDVRIEVAAVDGVDIEALHSRVAQAAQRKVHAASTARALKSSRPSSRHQPVPLASPPLLPRLDASVGPGSPRDEDAKRRLLPSMLPSPHPLRGQPDQSLDVSALAGLLTPRSSSPTSRPSRLQLASSAAQERQIASQQAALIRAFGSLVFADTEVGSAVGKTLTLRNRTPLPVQFQWKQEKLAEQFPHGGADDDAPAADAAADEDDPPFSIQPAFGSFAANSVVTFHFTFHPSSRAGPRLHRSRAKFVVENVPENLAVEQTPRGSKRKQQDKQRRDEEKEHSDAEDDEEDTQSQVAEDDQFDEDGNPLLASAFSSTLARARQETAAGSLIDVDYLVLSLQGLALGVPVSMGPQSGPLIVSREGSLQLDGLPVTKWVEIENRSTKPTAQTSFEFLQPLVTCVRKQGCSDAMLSSADPLEQSEEELEEPLGELSITPSSGVLAPGSRMRCLVSFVPRLLGRYTLDLSARVHNLLASCATLATKPDQLSVRFAFETQGPKLSFVCPPPAPTAVANLPFSPAAAASAALAVPLSNLGLLDFGLLNFGVAGVTSSRDIVVRNGSASARAWWSLGEQGQRAPAFLREDGSEPPETMLDATEDVDGSAGQAQLESLGDEDAQQRSAEQLQVSGGVLTFSPARGILDPDASVVVTVTFRPRSTAPLASHVALYTRHSRLAGPQYIAARAHVQAPVLSVLPCSIVMDMRTFRQMNDAEEEAKRQRAEREQAEAAAAEAARVAAELAAKIDREKAVAAAKLAAEIAELARATEERKAAEALALSQKGKKKPSAAALAKQKKEAEAAAAAAALAAAEAKAQEPPVDETAPVDDAAASNAGADGDLAAAESPRSLMDFAEAAPIAAPVNPAIMTSDSTVCVRVPRVFEVRLRNLTNLPAVYRWSVVGNGSTVDAEEAPTAVAADGSLTSATRSARRRPYEVRFSPSQGSLAGREDRLVQITLVAHVSGLMHLLCACDIEGVSAPLAVEIKANVKDLTVSYHALSAEDDQAMTDELRATGLVAHHHGGHHRSPSQSHHRSASQSSTQLDGSAVAASPRGLHSAGGLYSPFLAGSASAASVAFSARSGRTDFSTAEGQEKLHARTAVLDRWVPAKQVHSKITTVDDAGEEEKQEDGVEEVAAEEPSALEEEVLADGSTPAAIVPTASGLPALDFGSAVAPGSRRTLVLVLRNHTVIPARFVASMARLGPSRIGVAQSAAAGEGGKKKGAAMQLLQKKKEAAVAAASAAATPSTPTAAAAGSALQAAKRLSAADSTLSQRSMTSSVGGGGGGDRASVVGSSTKSLRHGLSSSDLKATKPQPKKMLMLSASAEQESKLAFQSANGQQFTAQQAMRAADQAVIPAAQGVAFVLSASSGLLEPYSTYSLAVTVLTDANGEFRDDLVLRVRGLGSVRIPVSVGVSGPCVSISRKTLGVLFPDSAVAARNKIEQVQGTVLSPVHATAAAAAAPGSLEAENAALKAAQPAAALVQHGFDRYPKLFFRNILVQADQPEQNAALGFNLTRALSGGGGGGGEAAADAFDARLTTYNTSARGAATARGRLLQPDQFRSILLENAGPRDVKIVWKQFDLRSIGHDRLVEVLISPRARHSVDATTGQEQLVQLDVSRYVYPDSTLSSSQASGAAGAAAAGGDETSRSSDAGSTALFPFVLDPTELVVPARGSASFKVIYDPSLRSGGEEVVHDLSFIEGTIFIAAPRATEDDAAELASPSGASALMVVEEPASARSRKIGQVLADIERFEANTGVVTDPAGPDSDEEDDAVSLASALSRTPVLGGSSAAARRANAVAAYFAPKAAVDWQPAPEHLSRHLFRLVLSGRTMVPALFVDKAKGRLKFVVQVPRPDSAPAVMLSSAAAGSATTKDDFAKTMVRAPAESPSKTLRVNAVIPSVTASSSSSSLRAQLTMVKLLPLENRSGTTLSFRVTVGPSPRFALQLPNHVDASAKTKAGSKYAVSKEPPMSAKNSLLASLSSNLPPPNHLGWQSATAADASGASFTLGIGEALVLPIRFSAPHPEQAALDREDGSEGEWPLRPSVLLSGVVSLQFSNGTVQSIPLEAELLRPQLDVSPAAHNFGSVHVRDTLAAFGAQSEEVGNGGRGGDAQAGFVSSASKDYLALLRQRKLTLTLSNPSLVDAHWSVIHLPRGRRPSSPGLRSGAHNPAMHPALLSALASAEFDSDADTIDDPAAFTFAAQSGVVPAGAGSLAPAAAVLPSGVVTELGLTAAVHSASFGRNLSGSSALPGSTKPEVALRTPVQISVQFRPRLKRRYKSRFLVVCTHGANMGQPTVVELRGTGSFDEDLPAD